MVDEVGEHCVFGAAAVVVSGVLPVCVAVVVGDVVGALAICFGDLLILLAYAFRK